MFAFVASVAFFGCGDGLRPREVGGPPADSGESAEDVRDWVQATYGADPELVAILLRIAEHMEAVTEQGGDRAARTPSYGDLGELHRHSGAAADTHYAELRARVLRNAARAEAWESFSAAQSGHVLETLESLCGLPEPSGVAIDGACPDERDLSVVFVNGVNNDPYEALLGACLLFDRTWETHAACCPERAVGYALAYNHSGGLLLDLLEAYLQRGGPAGTLTELLRIVGGLIPDPIQELVEVVLDGVASFIAAIDPMGRAETAAFTEYFQGHLAAGGRVLVYAHSQGNLFVDAAWEGLGRPELADFGVVPIAPPAASVAGLAEGTYVTLRSDLVIGAIPGALPGNLDNTDSSGEDFLHHGLTRSYLGHDACNSACQRIRALSGEHLGVAAHSEFCATQALEDEVGFEWLQFGASPNVLGDGYVDLVMGTPAALQVLPGGPTGVDTDGGLTLTLSGDWSEAYTACSFRRWQGAADANGNGYEDLLVQVLCFADEVTLTEAEYEQLNQFAWPLDMLCESDSQPDWSCTVYRQLWLRLGGGTEGTVDEGVAIAHYHEPLGIFGGVEVSTLSTWVYDLQGDFDGDGAPDIVVAADDTGGSALQAIAVQPALLAGALEPESLPHVMTGGLVRALGDLNGDGLVEIIGAREIRLGGHAIDEAEIVSIGGGIPLSSAQYPTTDFNGDGHGDLLLFTEDGDSFFSVFGPLPAEVEADGAALWLDATVSAVGEISGDGASDLVLVECPEGAGGVCEVSALTELGGGGHFTPEDFSDSGIVLRPDCAAAAEDVSLSGVAMLPGNVAGGTEDDLLVEISGRCYGDTDLDFWESRLFFSP